MPTAREERIRVAVVDDNVSLRAGLRALIEVRDELEIVADGRRDAAALAAIASERPSVIVVGIDAADGLDFLVQPRDGACADSRPLVVTASKDPALHYAMLCRGAMGILPKEELAEALGAAILCVHAGRAWIDSAIMSDVLAHMEHPREHIGDGVLTPREHEIASLVSRGLRNPCIAERLFLSEGTVRNHLTVIFRKLDVTDRYGLMARWQEKW
jgi:DNA-binding NarL/FixJ family response regulator